MALSGIHGMLIGRKVLPQINININVIARSGGFPRRGDPQWEIATLRSSEAFGIASFAMTVNLYRVVFALPALYPPLYNLWAGEKKDTPGNRGMPGTGTVNSSSENIRIMYF